MGQVKYLTPGEGRNTMVFLTEKGRKLMEDTVYKVIQIENTIYDTWTPEEQKLFMKLNFALRRIFYRSFCLL